MAAASTRLHRAHRRRLKAATKVRRKMTVSWRSGSAKVPLLAPRAPIAVVIVAETVVHGVIMVAAVVMDVARVAAGVGGGGARGGGGGGVAADAAAAVVVAAADVAAAEIAATGSFQPRRTRGARERFRALFYS